MELENEKIEKVEHDIYMIEKCIDEVVREEGIHNSHYEILTDLLGKRIRKKEEYEKIKS